MEKILDNTLKPALPQYSELEAELMDENDMLTNSNELLRKLLERNKNETRKWREKCCRLEDALTELNGTETHKNTRNRNL